MNLNQKNLLLKQNFTIFNALTKAMIINYKWILYLNNKILFYSAIVIIFLLNLNMLNYLKK